MSNEEYRHALPLGCELDNYRLLDVLGVGGFGITYLAEHLFLGNLVAIKEYLPNEFAMRDERTVHPKSAAEAEDFEWGLAQFEKEARTLTQFSHSNIVKVTHYFKANNTAYIVMNYEKGEPLDKIFNDYGTLSESQLKRVVLPIAEGIREVHGAEILHRDIKPGNIFVREQTETPVLLDFGSARQDIVNRSRSVHSVATAGYSPPEQYENEGNQGPWTDIYALCAVCYKGITGEAPPESTRRQGQLLRGNPDPLRRLNPQEFPDWSPDFLSAVEAGLQLLEKERPQTVDEWLDLFADQPMRARVVDHHEAGTESPSPAAPELRHRNLEQASEPEESTRTRRGYSKPLVAGWAVAAAVVVSILVLPRSESPSEEESGLSPVLGTGRAILVVETEPPGVEVLLDGQPIGISPLQLTNLPAGIFDVQLRHEHYVSRMLWDRSLADGVVLRIEETLQRGQGDLTLFLDPPGSWVEFDGRRLADRAPVTLEGLDAGELRLRLGAPGYRPEFVTVNVPKDDVGIFEYRLQPIPMGTLTLALEPPDAEVAMPSSAVAYSPGMRLPEGDYEIVVSREGFVESRLLVTVTGNVQERVELVREAHPLTVAVSPSEAAIEFVGRNEGYRDGMLLPPGDYVLSISADGYRTLQQSISHGVQPSRIEVELERLTHAFSIVTSPSGARIEFVELDAQYSSGMELPPGEYRLQITAAGYVGREETITHGDRPTEVEIVMRRDIPAPGERFRDCPLCPEMVALDTGDYIMGCQGGDCDEDELPAMSVGIGYRFALGRKEVTVSEFRAFVDATGFVTAAERDATRGCRTLELLTRQQWDYTPGRNWRDQEYTLDDAQPVVCVSWFDAQAYVEWLTESTGEPYRLPSEAEWEFAARSGSAGTHYFFGDSEQVLCDYANVSDQTPLPDELAWGNPADCSDGSIFPVATASYLPNSFGLYDMHGNVWEWVRDCYKTNYVGYPADGSPWLGGDCGSRVMRGGSWASNALVNRASNRGNNAALEGGSFLGFRVARSLLP